MSGDGSKMKSLGRLALFSAAFFWGMSFIAMKSVLTNISPLYILAFRFCGAALILSPACFRKIKKLDRSYLQGGALMGLALLVAYMFQTYGLRYTTPGKNAFLTSSYCIMAPFLYWLFLKKKPDKYNAAAALVCITGIGLITIDSALKVGLGDALTVVCGFFFAIHIVITARYVADRDPVMLAMLQFAAAGVAALAAALIFENPPQILTAADVWTMIFLIVVSTSVCILLQIFGQKFTPPSQAAVIMTFESVFGALSSLIILHEVMTARLVAGFAMTFLAVIISETKLVFFRKLRRT